MHGLEISVVIGVAVLLCTALARRWHVAPPVLLLVVGAALGADAASASADDDADPGTDNGGESDFGPWDALEGTLGAAKEREELLSGFAAGGVWDKHPPGRSSRRPWPGRSARTGGARRRPARS